MAQAEVDRVAGRHACSLAHNLWLQIKPALRRHQRRELCLLRAQAAAEAGIEWDVEHFRPEAARWNVPDRIGWFSLAVGGTGRPWLLPVGLRPTQLPLANCKRCNGNHRGFPVAGARALTTTDPRTLRAESAHSMQPWGPDEADPELLTLRWRAGTAAGWYETHGSATVLGPRSRCWKLNRPDLDFARSEAIMHLWNALQLSQGRHREQAVRTIEAMTGPGAKFTNCARSFRS